MKHHPKRKRRQQNRKIKHHKERKLRNLSMEMTAELGKDALAIKCITLHHGIMKDRRNVPMARRWIENSESWSPVHSIMRQIKMPTWSANKSRTVRKMCSALLKTVTLIWLRSWTRKPSTISKTISLWNLSHGVHLATTLSGSLMMTLTSASRAHTKWLINL